MPEGGGENRDSGGTLIINFLLGIRFQFQVPTLGKGFDFNVTYNTKDFWEFWVLSRWQNTSI